MPIQIQLQKPEFRFVMIQQGTKSPIEEAWQITEEAYESQPDNSYKNKVTGEIYSNKNGVYKGQIHNYRFNDIGLTRWLSNGNSFGVMTGYPYDFCILDSETDFLYNIYKSNFPETAVNQSGSGKGYHVLLFIKGINRRIIFEKEEEINGSQVKIHLGELQHRGQQCLCPDSLHPSGGRYKVLENKPIATIEYADFEKIFKPYFQKEPEVKNLVKKWKKTKWKGDRVRDIPLTNIFNTIGLERKGNILQGPHPIHGSSTGQNFIIDTNRNEWVCFRGGHKPPHGGGGAWTAIAITEGLVNCEYCQKGFQLSDEQKRKVALIAHEKYGLRSSEDCEIPNGWNKSIKISIMYGKYHDNNLHCGKPLIFDDERGIARCTECSFREDLRSLARRAAERIRLVESLDKKD